MRRVASMVAVTVLVAGSGAAAVRAGATTVRPAAESVSVDPATDLAPEQTVQLTVSGYPAATGLGAVECTSGAVEIGSCETNHVAFVTTDTDGNAQVDLQVDAQMILLDRTVDCTVADACEVAVAVLTDINDTTATAPISFAALPAPVPGSIDAPTAPIAGDQYPAITASGFAPTVLVDLATCAHGATTPDDCEAPARGYADQDGAVSVQVLVPSSLDTQGGDVVDCTVTGACDLSAWDDRDFSTVAASPLSIAPEVAGTIKVTPATELHDGDVVQVRGSGWPADQYLELDECTGRAPNDCQVFDSTTTDGQGRIATSFTVQSHSNRFEAPFDCSLDRCSLAATWYADAFSKAIVASQPIAFATIPEVAHYRDDELAAMQQAASTLGMTPARLQHDGSLALDFVLHVAHISTITPAPDTGSHAIETDWLPSADASMTAFASSEGATLPELEKTGALFVAYVLALQGR